MRNVATRFVGIDHGGIYFVCSLVDRAERLLREQLCGVGQAQCYNFGDKSVTSVTTLGKWVRPCVTTEIQSVTTSGDFVL